MWWPSSHALIGSLGASARSWLRPSLVVALRALRSSTGVEGVVECHFAHAKMAVNEQLATSSLARLYAWIGASKSINTSICGWG